MSRKASFRTVAHLAWSGALLAALSLIGCSGKGVGGACADIASCGGDPAGDWKIVSACQFDNVQQKSLNDSLTNRYATPQSPALTQSAPPSATSAGDWCQNLGFITPSDGTATSLLLRLNSEPVEYVLGGVVSAAAPAATPAPFGAVLSVEHHFAVHFGPTCLGAHGVPPTCAALTEFGSGGKFLNYNDFLCNDSSDGGCDCTYLYFEGTTETASYAIVGSQLVVVNAASLLPPRTYDYCIQGDTMTMAGHNGIGLFGSKNLRSIVATRCATAGCN